MKNEIISKAEEIKKLTKREEVKKDKKNRDDKINLILSKRSLPLVRIMKIISLIKRFILYILIFRS